MTIEWTEEQKQQLLVILNEQFLFLKNGEAIRRDQMSHELKARVLNVDLTKEMFDLWYEVTYLRFLLNQVINETPHLLKRMEDDEVFDDCRRRAQIYLKDKFKIDLEYTQPREEQDEKIND